MRSIQIQTVDNNRVLQHLNKYIKGTITENYGEQRLTFSNNIGKGTIRSISYDFGFSFIDYDVVFNKDVKFVFNIYSESPIEFLYLSEGSIQYSSTDENHNFVPIERYQNVIISNKINASNTFVFPSNIKIKVNTIQLIRNEFKKRKQSHLDSLQLSIIDIFKGISPNHIYLHFGNYNIKIADYIKALNKVSNCNAGLIKTLSIEGYLYLILAQQLAEHKNHENRVLLPDCLSQDNIKKIHKLTDYILENISNNITIEILYNESGMSPKKLQTGFKLLYNKSINEYIKYVRLELARDLINNTDMSISEIVYNIGYRSRSYFSKVFFEHYGILPINYKANIKSNPKSI